MDIKTLQQSLIEAFTTENLNKISLTLINLYKSQEYGCLQKIANIIEDYVTIEINENGKGFSKFMKLYHPDRVDYYRNEIRRLADEGDFDGLLSLSHILKLERIEEIADSLESYEDIDYSPVYEWDIETEGFHIFTVKGDYDNDSKRKSRSNINVFDAVKIRNYGHTDIEFPPYYLEDWEECELCDCDINDLEGIQFFVHVAELDLSNNNICDLQLLSGLINIEHLNLANNKISIIDDLDNLLNLKSLTLSYNKIKDIEPLFSLKNLEYVDLTGNPVKATQVKELKDKGVLVDF
jgi:Leucine-rich repeat (LRR) protein